MAKTQSIAILRHWKKIAIMACIFLSPLAACANPWLPEVGGWKYNLEYSKNDTPRSIKFYETDQYFEGEKNKALLAKRIDQANQFYKAQIDSRQNYWLTQYSQQYIQQHNIFAGDPYLQILYTNRNNEIQRLNGYIAQISNLQQYLITSYHKWGARTAIEYGLSDNVSYGVNIGYGREVKKWKAKSDIDHFSLFAKTKLFEYDNFILTLQPKFIRQGPMNGLDLTVMLGKSAIMKKKLLGKKIEVFGYSSFEITKFPNNNSGMRSKAHFEITSGFKWNDRTIFMNQESEDCNAGLNKTYKRVLTSKFTVAHDINFASIEPRNKVYLTYSYFTIDSLKAKRRLSSGYSVGLWLEL